MNGKLYTQSYRLDRSNNPLIPWIPEELGYGEHDYEFDESKTCCENAGILSERLKAKLVADYAKMNVEPHPNAALIFNESAWFGVEMFYQNQDGTMRLSARVIPVS